MAKHKCKVPDPPADTTRWLGTYGDMVTLLMAFFVMLFAVSDTNVQKFEAFIAGLAGPFDNQTSALNVISAGAESEVNPIEMIAPAEGVDHDSQTHLASGGATVHPEDGQGSPSARQLDGVEAEIEQILQASALPISADVRDDERGLVVAITTDEVLFATGSALLNPEGRALITELGPVLRDAPNTLVVEGHTDDQPLDRTGYTNWNLSTDRAVAVVQMLGDEISVPFSRISAGGYADQRPLAPNDSPENRAKNRRVEILIVALDPEQVPEQPAAEPSAGTSVAEIAPPPVLDFSEPMPTGSTPLASIIGR